MTVKRKFISAEVQLTVFKSQVLKNSMYFSSDHWNTHQAQVTTSPIIPSNESPLSHYAPQLDMMDKPTQRQQVRSTEYVFRKQTCCNLSIWTCNLQTWSLLHFFIPLGKFVFQWFQGTTSLLSTWLRTSGLTIQIPHKIMANRL